MHLSILVRSNRLEIAGMISTRQIIENPAAGLAATNVECRHGLVSDHEVRMQRERVTAVSDQ